MGRGFVCQRCGNDNVRFLGLGKKGETYCRKCLEFSGAKAEPYEREGPPVPLELPYSLTEPQRKVSDQVLECAKIKKPVLIKAVTGAGKTELVFATMEWFLQRKLKVAFATPRHDVVLEIGPRIKKAFPHAKIAMVCHGHTDDLTGDVVVLTAHQLYRYPNYFDLVVFDEIDAFPYHDNELLKNMFRKAVRGTYVLLSATPSGEDLDEISKRGGRVIELNSRFHGKPLPVPEYRKAGVLGFANMVLELKKMVKEGRQVFLFVPTIFESKRMFNLVKHLVPKGESVNSEDEYREEKISAFKSGHLRYLVTTAVLERGVTVADLQVLVFNADSEIYSPEALVQIAGRAGRIRGFENGKVLFYGNRKEGKISRAISIIEQANEKARMQKLLC